ncbi:extracellular solute-binding protein [Paenibacillaceae bacterium]|nr:extracellular solute-binding protein [Paenibacillaceae bacterium]
MRLKQVSFASFMLALALLCASCANHRLVPEQARSAADPATEVASPQIVLEFWHTYSELEKKVFETSVLPLFEQQYPNIRIHPVQKDYTEQLKMNILAAVADHKQPDIMRMDIIWVPELAKLGVLEELSSLEGFPEIKQQFIGSLIETNRYQGLYYGLPVNANTKMAIFNMRLLREAGLQKPPSSFDELVAAQQRLSDKYPGLSSIGICCAGAWGTLPYFWTFGGKLTDEHYTKASGYLDSPESMAAIRKLKLWFDEGKISPSILTGEPGTWDGILKGDLLMIDEAHWFYSVNAFGDNESLLQDTEPGLIPDDAGAGTSIIGGENLVLFNSSRHKEAAWRFMRWMMTEEPQSIMAETGLIPTVRSLQYSNENNAVENNVKQHKWFAPYIEQLARALPRPPVSTWTQIDDEYARMIEYILSDELPLEQAVQQSVKRIDALLQGQ